MAFFKRKHSWALPEREATPERIFQSRRLALKKMGYTGLGLSAWLGAGGAMAGLGLLSPREARASDNPDFISTFTGLPPLQTKPGSPEGGALTPTHEAVVAGYNNYYEFSRGKDDVWEHARSLKTEPWRLDVSGLVSRPRIFDLDELRKGMELEERIYRFRCVEAWAMVVPWTGFPLSALLEKVQPLSSARYVKFTTFLRPEEAPRQQRRILFGSGEPWPYTEGITMAEAMHPLTMISVGSYGHVLPNQNGAPLRLIIPWKYGFKNIKAIVGIELVKERPKTFWNTLLPDEYGFESNVNPAVPHPRWSQATERDVATGEARPTLYLNGYAAQVEQLYKKG